MVFPFQFPEQKLRIIHFPMHATYPTYCYLIPQTIFLKSRDYEAAHNIVFFIPLLRFSLSPTYNSQHTNLRHPQPVPPYERPGFTPV